MLITESILWSIFPIITFVAVSKADPFYAAGFSSLIAGLFFATMVTHQKKWSEIKVKAAWLSILILTVFIGVGYYGLTFTALKYTSPGNQSLLGLSQIAFSFIILGPLLGEETITKQKIYGCALMILGATAILFQNTTVPNIGDLLVILAAMISVFGNLHAKKAMKLISVHMVMFLRSILAGIILILIGWLSQASTDGLTDAWFFFIFNGILLFGVSKILWLEAIKRIDISQAVGFFPVSTAFTLIFAYLLLDQAPTTVQVVGFVPICAGLWILTRKINHN